MRGEQREQRQDKITGTRRRDRKRHFVLRKLFLKPFLETHLNNVPARVGGGRKPPK